jgi:hypothetical protein
MHENASIMLAAHRYAMPATTPPPANMSGYAASITAVIAPPADSPVTCTRAGFAPVSVIVLRTICAIDSASPWPRVVSPRSNQLKHLLKLLPLCCSGSTMENFSRSASCVHPAPVPYPDAFCVHPCSATTTGLPAGNPVGT